MVSHPLSMREAPGSIPGVSIFPNLSSPCFELSFCLSINVSLSLYRLSRVYPSLSLCVSVSLSLSLSRSLTLSLSLSLSTHTHTYKIVRLWTYLILTHARSSVGQSKYLCTHCAYLLLLTQSLTHSLTCSTKIG